MYLRASDIGVRATNIGIGVRATNIGIGIALAQVSSRGVIY